MRRSSDSRPVASLLVAVLLLSGCASVTSPYTTKRDKTAKGAGIGAAAGAAAAILRGEREADEILAGAAVGGVVGAGVGVYMDAQEERLARIPGTTVERVGDNLLLVRFDSNVLFDVDSAIIGSDGRATLDRVAEVLVEYPKTAVIIQGHTDSTGTEGYNLDLSNRRAEAARAFLVGRGVDSGRMSAVGYGEGYPVASNETASGRSQNRRVDILLKAKVK
ncbi:MAG: OmpA family protein [Thermoanaerobaculia bacterium]|nr:OmpA family protein [Thermoanaerobaculia bacterium]